MKIVVNDFVKRQTPDSRFSHFTGSWDELRDLVEAHWENAKPGYREGVLLVRVPVQGFFTSVVKLAEGAKLMGDFVPRREGEFPRKTLTTTSRDKSSAQSVDIVLYNTTVLAEDALMTKAGCTDGSMIDEPSWEIISINASCVAGETPMSPMVLMHNHFGSSGGTSTHLTDTDFVDMLRHSFEFWRDKATCG